MKPSDQDKRLTRRDFMGTAAAVAAFTIVPRHVLGGQGCHHTKCLNLEKKTELEDTMRQPIVAAFVCALAAGTVSVVWAADSVKMDQKPLLEVQNLKTHFFTEDGEYLWVAVADVTSLETRPPARARHPSAPPERG